MEESLKKIYYDVNNPASFGSPYNLYKAVKPFHTNVTLKQVKEWLSSQDSYVLHRRVVRKFPRRRTIASGIAYQWQTDLADMSSISRYNNNYKYLCVIIDVFSRYLIVRKTKKKDGASMERLFRDVFKTHGPPLHIQCDGGSEFWNSKVKKLFRERGVKLFTTSSDTKAAIVERVILTLKNKMFKYFTSKNTLRYVDILQQLVEGYNNTVHSSLGIAPIEVNCDNERSIWKKQYSSYFKKSKRNDNFHIGDTVVITKIRKQFKKGYLPRWSNEHFVIIDHFNSNPNVWRLMDERGEIIEGTFYSSEIQKVR